jgi:hypothetical protein
MEEGVQVSGCLSPTTSYDTSYDTYTPVKYLSQILIPGIPGLSYAPIALLPRTQTGAREGELLPLRTLQEAPYLWLT